MIKKLVALFLISSQLAVAGLPPTTSKGLGDASPSVTFNYQFPGYPITHTGTTASLGIPTTSAPNYVGLDTAFANANTDDRNAESSLGNWLGYKNTVAGVSPDAGMTGGAASGNVTLTRSVTTPLNGKAHFLVTKGAFNVQGEGFSVIANIPPAYRTSNATISIPFKVISGSLVSGDLKAYVYDVTNSQLITPFNNDVVGSQGVLTANFAPNSTTAQIRIGFHFASTVATALTLAFDDVSVGPVTAALGMAGSNTTSDSTMTIGGMTATGVQITRWQVGDRLYVQGFATAGTVTASPFYVTLPTGLKIAGSPKTPTSPTQAGWVDRHTSTSQSIAGASAGPWLLYTDGSTNDRVYLAITANSNTVAAANANNFNNGEGFSFKFDVPIAGYDANVTMGQSSTHKISSFLANGTRVTTTPQNLGEYRALQRNANSNAAFTDVAPAAAPNGSDGIRVYGSNSYAAGDTASQPSKYEVFVGKNKQIKWEWYSNTGRTGFIQTTPTRTGNIIAGYFSSYDPTTGVATVWAPFVDGNETNHTAGYNSVGVSASAYLDITVSENALAVGTQALRSSVSVDTATGYGSTNTKIRKFTSANAVTLGTAIQYVSDAVLGDSFKILEDGVYAMKYMDNFTTSDQFGISLNTTTPTTSIQSIAEGERIALVWTTATNGVNEASDPGVILKAGDVIRAHCTGTASGAGVPAKFRITKVAN